MKNIVKKVKKIFTSKFIFLGVLPLLLVAFWFISSLFLNNKISFSILLYQQPKNDIKITFNRQYEENKIIGKFKAKDNNLGLIMLRFSVDAKKSEDIFTFKFKKEGDRTWSHSNNYRSVLLNSRELFPLGIPVIKDSKDKIFQFEISSKNNTVNIDNFGFFTGYEFSKNELISNKKEGLAFLIKKIITSFTNLDFLSSSVRYMLPLFAYLFAGFFVYLILRFGSQWGNIKVKNFEYKYIGFSLFLIFSDIFMIKKFYLGVIIFLILIWIYSFSKRKLESRIIFFLALILILIWVILIWLRVSDFQNKINIWTYTCLVIGLSMAVVEERSTKNK